MKRILRTLRRKLRTAKSLTWQDWQDLALAWVMLLLVDIGLRTMPFLRLQRLLERTSQGCSLEQYQVDVVRLEHLVGISARNNLYQMTCLRQALALQWMLAKRGVEVELKIGVRKWDDRLEAHSWLEWQEIPIGQTGLVMRRFVPIRNVVK
jgi:hypothetical protein